MSKLYNYKLTCEFTTTYTAESYEEATERLREDEGDVEITDCSIEDFEPGLDDYMNGR